MTTATLANGTNETLEQRISRYHAALPGSDADHYLQLIRGLSRETIETFRLGFVDDPCPTDETYKGRIAIPYLTQTGIVTATFRAIMDESSPKYLKLPGNRGAFFNASAFDSDADYICVIEGEIDTMTCHQAEINATGLPGATQWKDWMALAFNEYTWVIVPHDDDEAGAKFAEAVCADVDHAHPVAMTGGDINEFYLRNGASALKRHIGVD